MPTRCSTTSPGRSRRASAGSSSDPTAPARPPCCSWPPRGCTRPRGVAGVLGEVLGAVDVFELRPRIGLASAAIAERIPADELVAQRRRHRVVRHRRPLAREYDDLDYARADELLEALGRRPPGRPHRSARLSEGERKRVQIARALMTDPELMLLDEPAAGLDLGGREDLVARLGVLAADTEAPALVLVTHHVEEIPPGFTDVLLLRDGRIVAAGPLELTLTAENLSRDLRPAARGRAARRPLDGAGQSDVRLPRDTQSVQGPRRSTAELGVIDRHVAVAAAQGGRRMTCSRTRLAGVAGGRPRSGGHRGGHRRLRLPHAGRRRARRLRRGGPRRPVPRPGPRRGRRRRRCCSRGAAVGQAPVRGRAAKASPWGRRAYIGRSAFVLQTVTEHGGGSRSAARHGRPRDRSATTRHACAHRPDTRSGSCPSRGPPAIAHRRHHDIGSDGPEQRK